MPIADFCFSEGVLSGKNAFITGGASGIGLGITTRLAMAGANVVIASRRGDLCADVARHIEARQGVKALGMSMDVRDSASVNEAVDRAAEAMGGIDIVVNNAAGNFYYPASQLSDNQWKAVLEIDLYGTFYVSRAAFPHLKDKEDALIINISMTLHRSGWVGMVHACAAKAGIDAITHTLALEWAPHRVRVNAIAPGPIVTEGVERAFAAGGSFQDQADSVPLGRNGRPDEVGDLAVFMASPAASWMTGEIVTLDGGAGLAGKRTMVNLETLEELVAEMRASR